MTIAGQLYQLQENEFDIESRKRRLAELTAQLGETPEVIKARNDLAAAQQQLDDLDHQQHSLEWEIDDISAKFKSTNDKLYGGRVNNPKELANLQQEAQSLKTKQSERENRVLDIMSEIEQAADRVTVLKDELKQRETAAQGQQQQLAAEIEQLKDSLDSLKRQHETLAVAIEPAVLETFRKLRAQKGLAVARVDKGRCQGCHILLASIELQRARTGLVQCSSCGRVLYIA